MALTLLQIGYWPNKDQRLIQMCKRIKSTPKTWKTVGLNFEYQIAHLIIQTTNHQYQYKGAPNLILWSRNNKAHLTNFWNKRTFSFKISHCKWSIYQCNPEFQFIILKSVLLKCLRNLPQKISPSFLEPSMPNRKEALIFLMPSISVFVILETYT